MVNEKCSYQVTVRFWGESDEYMVVEVPTGCPDVAGFIDNAVFEKFPNADDYTIDELTR